MSTITRRPAILFVLIGMLASLFLFSLPLAAQDDSPPPTPVTATDPDTTGLPPAPDLSKQPADDAGDITVEQEALPPINPAPDTATQNGAEQQLAPDQLATCRPKGVQIVRIDNADLHLRL